MIPMSDPVKTEAQSPPPRRRGPPRRVTVSRVQRLSPAMLRITLGGPALADFPAHLPASYIKLIFPEPGQSEPPPFTPDGPRPASMRTYTPLRFDAATQELDVDFVLHGEGPASTWAAQAQLGQALLLMGPGPGYPLPEAAASYLLIGDDSALPALETILARLPAGMPVQALVEVVDAREERPLASPAALKVQWLARGTDNQLAGQPIEAALRAQTNLLASMPQPCHIYLACEAAAMRRIRSQLLNDLGVPRTQLVARGYWKLGAVNHPDHDYGE